MLGLGVEEGGRHPPLVSVELSKPPATVVLLVHSQLVAFVKRQLLRILRAIRLESAEKLEWIGTGGVHIPVVLFVVSVGNNIIRPKLNLAGALGDNKLCEIEKSKETKQIR